VALADVLKGIRSLEDLPALTAALGHEPLWDPVPDGREPTVVVGRAGDFPWYAVSGQRADGRARALARRMAGRGRLCGVFGLDPGSRRLTITISLAGAPRLSLPLAAPSSSALAALGRLSSNGSVSATVYAAHAADALGGEAVGHRFFEEFRSTLARMAAALPGPFPGADRHALALLQLTRVLFLYFVQAKGWLAGNSRFLAEAVDRCLARRRRIHRDLLRPLFFGTLNRPAHQRGRIALDFGPIPFLNGGLFEPHPLERRLGRRDIPNPLWRDAFDRLFERFHFTVAEGVQGGIAPDMLGRVFEGVMAPDERRASGTYYTPAALVSRLLGEGLAALISHRLHCSMPEAEQRLGEGDPAVRRIARRLRILDPAVGSGAFLLGALERLGSLAEAGRPVAAARRLVLQRNLFGVDRNGAAVRLTELRLWLAVIADDPAERPLDVQPLPNLDCLIRQGDSLFAPAGSGLRTPDRSRASELAASRQEVVTAAGPAKRLSLRELARVEARIADHSLTTAEEMLREAITDCLEVARGADLFGGRRGLDRAAAERLAEIRGELRRIRSLRRAIAREGEVPWFDYRVQFADVFAEGGFDLVVGNPPWLRAAELPADLRRRLAGRYRWWCSGGHGYANRPDLAVAFLERSLELAAPGGVVAMLVPAKIAAAGYGTAARHALAGATTLVTVADLTGGAHASFQATVYPLALVIRKVAAPPGHRVRISLGPGRSVPQSSLRGGAPWLLGRRPLRDALVALRQQHPRLDAAVPCHLGVKTGANRIFLEPPEVEEELLRWAVRGRDLAPFVLRHRTRLLWTHGADGSPLPRLPPSAARYLTAHLPLLRSRTDYVGGPPWGLFRTRPATAPHRVVWADLARELRAVSLAGLHDTIPLNSCYVALLKAEPQADRLAAWLNSSWLRAAARAGAVPAAGDCRRYTANTVGALPLPEGVLSDGDLCTLSRSARAGGRVQADLDAITARYLDLGPAHRTALLASLGRPSEDRG
jgi:hypothetical protein